MNVSAQMVKPSFNVEIQQTPRTCRPPIQPALPDAADLMRDYQSATSQDALTCHDGNQSRATQSLRRTLRQFSYRLRKAGLQ